MAGTEPQAAGPLPWRAAAAVAGAGLLALAALDLLVRDEPVPRGDDLIYERMSEDPLGTHTFPFAYRVAIPWLVHVLPFASTTSFEGLGWLCSAAAAGFLFLLLERLRVERRLSVPLAVLLAVSPVLLVAALRQGRNPDPLTVAVMCAGALWIHERRPVALGVTMAVGVLNRESALFLAPWAYAAWADRPLDRDAGARVAAATVAPLALFLALRLAIPTVGREAVRGYGSALGGRLEVLEAGLSEPLVSGRRLAYAFGPLWLLLPWALAREPWVRRGIPLLVLLVVAATFALDWGRIAFVAAPLVYAGGALVLRGRPRLQAATLAGLALVAVAYAAYMQVEGVDRLVEESDPPYPVR